jgi:hypothetical protein
VPRSIGFAGTAKEFVEEIIGDGKLAEEGARQKRNREAPSPEYRRSACRNQPCPAHRRTI